MTLVDFHSHYPSRDGELIIQQDVDSVGLHPWYIDVGKVDEVINRLVNKLEQDDNKQIKAIGECGLDRLSTVSMDVQRQVFIKHIELSERFHLPIIIHCVKAVDEMLAIRHKYKPTQPWIWHGFRGKPEQLTQLLRAGFYVSFGFKYNTASLASCPLDRMLLETDDDSRPVSILYNKVCEDLRQNNVDIDIKKLASEMYGTFQTLIV